MIAMKCKTSAICMSVIWELFNYCLPSKSANPAVAVSRMIESVVFVGTDFLALSLVVPVV